MVKEDQIEGIDAVEIEDLKNPIQEDLTQEILVLVDLTEQVILKDLAQESLKIIQALEGLSQIILIAILDLGKVEENSIC